MYETLMLTNFRSFERIEVGLRPVNLVVGSNDSGKSNLLDVFHLFRDAEESTADYALIKRQGGVGLRNRRLADSPITRIMLERTDGGQDSLSVQLADDGNGYRILSDRLADTSGRFAVGYYDISPNAARYSAASSHPGLLESDARNLESVLCHLIEMRGEGRRISNLVRALFPSVVGLQVGPSDHGWHNRVTVVGESAHGTPLIDVSDGMLAGIALVVVLYFQDPGLVVMENPDRHLHPHLASQMMQMFGR